MRKFTKLSIVTALLAGSFSVANAIELENAIKNVDFSGLLRYRYDTGRVHKDKKHGFNGLMGNNSANAAQQDHKYKFQFNVKADIGDRFKVFTQLDYTSTDGGHGVGKGVDTGSSLAIRQAYLEYLNDNSHTRFLLGRQQLDTIWTGSGVGGLIGTGVKAVNTYIDGITLGAFAMDSLNGIGDGDTLAKVGKGGAGHDSLNKIGTALSKSLDGNLYGLSVAASYDALGGKTNSTLWAAYIADLATFYALEFKYSTSFIDDSKYALNFTYLGNTTDGYVKDELAKNSYAFSGGNFFGVKGTWSDYYGWDASLGAVYYGKKDKLTMNTFEDTGSVGVLAGEEIFYTSGSHLYGDIGENFFGFLTAGYSFDNGIRLGADFVYGSTTSAFAYQTKDNNSNNSTDWGESGGGKKYEVVARVDYKYSPKLSFSGFYSYVNVDGGDHLKCGNNSGNSSQTPLTATGKQLEGNKQSVRLQALYKF